MKEIICALMLCSLMKTITAASREDINIIRRLAISPATKFPERYLSKKWPTYSYKPYYRPRPSYTIPILVHKPYKPLPVKKPARPNKTTPNYSYQHISRPIDYFPRPQKPTSSNYPNLSNKPDDFSHQPSRPNENSPQLSVDAPDRPHKPDDLYNPHNQIHSTQKPTPSKPTKPIEHYPQKPNNYEPEDTDKPSYQIYEPKPSHTTKPNVHRPLTSLDYPHHPNTPDDLSNPSYTLYKPKPISPIYPNPIHTVSHPHTSNYLDSDDPQSYQTGNPNPNYQAYQSHVLSTGANSGSLPPDALYPSQFLQETSNMYEDEYPSQFYDPAQTTYLSQYLQNDNNWRADEDSYYDRVLFYPYEQSYQTQRPNGYDEIDDYPEIIEELDETVFKPQQERSLRRKSNDIFQKVGADTRRTWVPYKTFEYNPSAHNLLKIWKSKFYHPYSWWSHKIPQHIYYLHNKLHKPLKPHPRPYGYLNSPYPWGNLPLLSTRPASVHRIRNSILDSDSSIEDNYSDEVFENYLLRPSQQMDGFFGRSPSEENPIYFEKKGNEHQSN